MTYTFEEFRTELRAMGMTQCEFAGLTGLTAHGVMRWRRATKGVPTWVRSWLLMWKSAQRPIRDEIRAAVAQS